MIGSNDLTLENDHKVSVLMGRMEMYVSESKWKKADLKTKELLYTLTCKIEEKLQKETMKRWNEQRGDYHCKKVKKEDKILYQIIESVSFNELPL